MAAAIAVPPPVPGNVLAIDEVVNPQRQTLTITWSSVSGASHYKVKQSDTGLEVFSGAGTSVEVEYMGVPAIFEHTYAVSSCNAYACSAWVQSQYTVAKPKVEPGITAPSGSGSGSYTVSWDSVAGATSYELEEKKNNGSWTNAYSGGSRSKAFSGKTNASYHYRDTYPSQ